MPPMLCSEGNITASMVTMCKTTPKAIKAHGDDVSAESTVERGTAFIVTISLEPPNPNGGCQ